MAYYVGAALATAALAIGLFFFIFYAARYYFFTATVLLLNVLGRSTRNGNGNGHSPPNNRKGTNGNGIRDRILSLHRNGNHNGHNGNGASQNGVSFNDLVVEPFVSIHLPLYNEPNVVERLLTTCTSLDYSNYEVIVIDDSTDQTTDILREWAESNNMPMTLTDGGGTKQVQVLQTVLRLRTPVKIIHRNKRSGFKGGALNEALKHMNPKAEYVIIFDADFIPPPDIIHRFLAYLATCAPSAILTEIIQLDKYYAEGKVTLEEYLTQRQTLVSKLAQKHIMLEKIEPVHRSLFDLDQIFAKGIVNEEEYLVRRNAIMRELKKITKTLALQLENKLTLRQSFTVCGLFSEDKIDPFDFKLRMATISPQSRGKNHQRVNETATLYKQILSLDRRLANGEIDLKTYADSRDALCAQLLVLSQDRDELKRRFDLDQKLARGEIDLEHYMKKGVVTNGDIKPKRITRLVLQNGKTTVNGNGNGKNGHAENDRFVAVQGYQFHYLNRSENWLTQGIRAEFSGSYMIERACEEIFGAMKMIAGSVYMIKADVLRKYGWSESLTEDWELTCRLYQDGYKVIYTPAIQAPAECPSTIKRLIRQRQRWAEGHTYNAKRYFWSILRSPHVTIREKLEFIYFAPYYLQSVLFIAGTFLWLVSEYLHEYPPFWNQTFGWALLLSNLMALPLMNLAGLFSEGTAKKDLTGIFSAIVLSYILSIFQAHAALKGLLERKEGIWVRTYKTGVITETIRRFQVGKIWRSLTKARQKSTKAKSTRSQKKGERSKKRLLPGLSLLVLMILTGANLSIFLTTVTVTEVRGNQPPWWYDSNWLYRKQITIDHTKVPNTDQSDFPVLINLASDSQLYSHARSDGYDILFTSSDMATKIPYERERYTRGASTAALVAWVKVTTLSHTTDTVLYMYYGYSGAADQQDTTGAVWDTYYKGVWHLKEAPAGTAPQMKDSTSNHNDGTSAGSMTSGDQIAGRIDGSLDFDGSNDEITVPSSGLVITTDITIEAWVKTTSTGAVKGIVNKEISTYNGYQLRKHSDNHYRFAIGNPGSYYATSNSAYTDSNWHHIVGARRSGTNYLYVDGVQQTATFTQAITDSGANFDIGRAYSNYNGYWWGGATSGTGVIDEVRVSNTGRSSDWIATEYNNQNSPSTFYSVSGENSVPENALLLLPLVVVIPILVSRKRRMAVSRGNGST